MTEIRKHKQPNNGLKVAHAFMNGYFQSCVPVAAVLFVIGCGESRSHSVTAVERGGTKPAKVPGDVGISSVSTVLDTASTHSDHQKLQGSWTFVTLVAEAGQKDHIVFSGDEVSWHVGERTLKGTFVIDATHAPKRIDLKLVGEADDVVTLVGIYDFRSELLFICVREPGALRPTTLEATENQSVVMLHCSE